MEKGGYMDKMIGVRIKQRRKELGITQTALQKTTSLSSGHLSCIENGKYLPSAIALIELATALDCTVDWILTGKPVISKNFIALDITDSYNNDSINLLKKIDLLSCEERRELIDLIDFKLFKKRKAKSSPSDPETETA